MSPFLVNPFGFGGGGGAPSLPVTGELLWLRADTGIYTNTGGTTPATADGDAVLVWKDQSGNGYNATIGSGGPIYRPGTTNRGFGVLGFEHGSDQHFALPDALGTALHACTAAEMFVVFKNLGNNTSGAYGSWQLTVVNTGGQIALLCWSGDGKIHETFGRASGTALVVDPVVDLSLAFHVYDTYSAAGDNAVILDTTTLGTDGTSTVGFGTTSLQFGYCQTFTMNAYVQEVLIYPFKLTDAQRTSMNTYLTT